MSSFFLEFSFIKFWCGGKSVILIPARKAFNLARKFQFRREKHSIWLVNFNSGAKSIQSGSQISIPARKAIQSGPQISIPARKAFNLACKFQFRREKHSIWLVNFNSGAKNVQSGSQISISARKLLTLARKSQIPSRNLPLRGGPTFHDEMGLITRNFVLTVHLSFVIQVIV